MSVKYVLLYESADDVLESLFSLWKAGKMFSIVPLVLA